MKDDIQNDPSRIHARKAFNIQVVFGTAFTVLTGGVFLSGLAIYMGANDLLVNYISMIVNICGATILFFSSLMQRIHSFKKAAVTLTIFSKFTTLLIVLVPLLIPEQAQIAVFIPTLIIAFTLQAQTTVILNNWLVMFVDEKKSGHYIARRQVFVLAVTVILSLSGGKLLDVFSRAYIGFAILFFVAFLMAVLEVIMLLRIPDAIQQKPLNEKRKFWDMIRVPVRNREFLKFVIYIFVFYLFLTIADSFTVVYMIRYLELPYATTTAMQMLISLPQIFLLGVWGKIGDKKGHRFALSTSIWFFVGETLFLGLSNPQNLYICIPVAFLFAAVANAGFAVSVFNRRYELMPQEGRILYDNFYTAAIGIAFVLGPVIGVAVKGLLESAGWIEGFLQFGNIRLLYGISTVALILLQVIYQSAGRRKHSLSPAKE